MNILEVEDMVKGLPDDRLQQEAEMPTGQVPQFLVVSEIQRRSDMRKRFAERQQQQPQGTVKDQIIQEGIAAMAPPDQSMQAAMMGQQQQMPQEMMPPQGMPMPPEGMPMEQPPMGMYGGGVVRMAEGLQAPFSENDPRIQYLMQLKESGRFPTLESVLKELEGQYFDSSEEATVQRVTDESSSTVQPPNQQGVGSNVRNIPMSDIITEGNPAFEALRSIYSDDETAKPATALPSAVSPSQEMYDKNVGGFANVVDSTPEAVRSVRYPGIVTKSNILEELEIAPQTPGEGASKRDAEKINLNNVDSGLLEATFAPNADGESKVDPDAVAFDTSDSKAVYRSVLEQLAPSQENLAALGRETPELDVSKVSDLISQRAGAFEKFTKARADQGKLTDLVTEFTPDFKQYLPDYSSLITDQETRAADRREEGRKEAGAQALIQLGAGIAGGNLAGGISKAGEVSARARREARRDATAEEQLARRMQMAQQEARMSLGIQSETARERATARNNDLIVQQYGRDRQDELTALGFDDKVIADQIALETAVAQSKVATSQADRDAALKRITAIVSAQRYQDLSDDEQIKMDRQELALFSDVIKDRLDRYQAENPNASIEQTAKFAQELMQGLGIGQDFKTTDKKSGGVSNQSTPLSQDPDPLNMRN